MTLAKDKHAVKNYERNLVEDLRLTELRPFIFGVVGPKENAHDILAAADGFALRKKIAGKASHEILVAPETSVFAAREIAKIIEERVREQTPERAENDVPAMRIEG